VSTEAPDGNHRKSTSEACLEVQLESICPPIASAHLALPARTTQRISDSDLWRERGPRKSTRAAELRVFCLSSQVRLPVVDASTAKTRRRRKIRRECLGANLPRSMAPRSTEELVRKVLGNHNHKRTLVDAGILNGVFVPYYSISPILTNGPREQQQQRQRKKPHHFSGHHTHGVAHEHPLGWRRPCGARVLLTFCVSSGHRTGAGGNYAFDCLPSARSCEPKYKQCRPKISGARSLREKPYSCLRTCSRFCFSATEN